MCERISNPDVAKMCQKDAVIFADCMKVKKM